jgi:hypothetical protein
VGGAACAEIISHTAFGGVAYNASKDLGWLRQQRRPLHSGRTEQHKERRTLTYWQEEPLLIAVYRASHAWGVKYTYSCGTKLSIWMRVSLRRLEIISADFWRTR